MGALSPSVIIGGVHGGIEFLLDLSVKGTVLLFAAWMVARLFRRGASSTRHLIWTAALTGLLALPILGLVLPDWQIPIRTYVPEWGTQPVADSSAPAPAVSTESLAPPSIPWQTWLLAVWMLGGAIVLSRFAIGVASVSRITHRASLISDPAWTSLLEELSDELNVSRRTVMLWCGERTVPMTWGPFRPIILLPRDAQEWSESRRRLVLLHELSHVKRWDCLIQVVAQFACATFWFHPLAWVGARQLYVERERACDDSVLEVGERASEYARLLVDMVRRVVPAPGASIAALSLARSRLVAARVRAILDVGQSRQPLTALKSAVTAALAGLLVLPLAAMRPVTEVDVRAEGEPALTQEMRLEVLRLEAQGAKYFAKGQWEKAAEINEKLVGIKPGDAELWFKIGYLNRTLGSYDRCIQAYEQALRLGHRPDTAMYNLACAYSMKNEKDVALEWLNRAIGAGFRFTDLLKNDRDLENVRTDPRFENVLKQFI